MRAYLFFNEEIPSETQEKIIELATKHSFREISQMISLQDGRKIPPNRIRKFLASAKSHSASILILPEIRSAGGESHFISLRSRSKSVRLTMLYADDDIPAEIQQNILTYAINDKLRPEEICKVLRSNYGMIIPCNRIVAFLRPKKARQPKQKKRPRAESLRSKEVLHSEDPIPEELETLILSFSNGGLGVRTILKKIPALEDGHKISSQQIRAFLESKDLPTRNAHIIQRPDQNGISKNVPGEKMLSRSFLELEEQNNEYSIIGEVYKRIHTIGKLAKIG